MPKIFIQLFRYSENVYCVAVVLRLFGPI